MRATLTTWHHKLPSAMPVQSGANLCVEGPERADAEDQPGGEPQGRQMRLSHTRASPSVNADLCRAFTAERVPNDSSRRPAHANGRALGKATQD